MARITCTHCGGSGSTGLDDDGEPIVCTGCNGNGTV